ncbi:hypothetical protein ACS0TY_021068 [Phlomoides rotata]
MWSSSRDNWERLVEAFDNIYFSFSSTKFEPFLVPPSPSLPPKSLSSVSKSAAFRPITRNLFSAWYRRKPQDHYFDVPKEEDPEVHLGQLQRFSFQQLQVATDNFSNKNFLMKGSLRKIYKGRLADGTLVAVKRLPQEWTPSDKVIFQTDVEFISMAVHRNLLRLRGFCMTPTERLLVYPYIANGSVASCLRGNAFLEC